MKKLVCLVLSVAMLFALCACGETEASAPEEEATAAQEVTPAEEAVEPANPAADNGETFTFVINLNKGEPASTQDIAWMEAITEQSGGRIQFEPYYSSALLSPAEVPDGLKTGVIDIAVTSVSEYPSILTRSSYLATMPFTGISGEDFYGVYAQMMEEFPEIGQEYNDAGMVLLTYGFGPSMNLFTVSKNAEVKVPGDLQGMQILATESTLQELISNSGGAPVTAGPTDFYSYLERSVSDGIFNHWGMIVNFAIYEVVNQAVIFGEGDSDGITQALNIVVMSQSAWDSLPADLQQVFLDNEQFYMDEQKTVSANLVDRGLTLLDDQDAAIIHLSDEEVAQWQNAFAPVRDAVLAEIDEGGYNTAEIYERMIEIDAELNG